MIKIRAVFIILTLPFWGCSMTDLGVVWDSSSPEEQRQTDVLSSKRRLPPNKSGIAEIIYPPIVVPNEPEVWRFVRTYTSSNRPFFEQGYARRQQYLPLLKTAFERYGLPTELMNIAFVESCYKPQARSHRGAVGMWQFIPGTARAYGLRVSMYRDDRKDVSMSTDAAARHLSDLYLKFNDWHLAIAAYNGGAGRISRAMEQAGSRDFFEIVRAGALRKESSEFVQKFMALTLLSRDPKRYGFFIDDEPKGVS